MNESAFTIDLDSLEEGANYRFRYEAVNSKGRVSGQKEGTFKTFKKAQADFTFVVSSCATLMTNTDSFNDMSSLKPDFFVNVGDLHYAGTNQTTADEFVFAYHEAFKSKNQRSFYESVPLVYTFDDHDVGDNNADGHSNSSGEVNKAYKVRRNYF